MDHIFFLSPSVRGHLGCFHLLAVVDSAAINRGVRIPVWVPAFNSFGAYPEVDLLDHNLRVFLVLGGILAMQRHTTWLAEFSSPTRNWTRTLSMDSVESWPLDCQGIPHNQFFVLFFWIKKKFFLAVLGLHCCAWAFSSCGERGLLLVAVHRLLIVVATLFAEHRL